jgi:surfeit locus 1 family protein
LRRFLFPILMGLVGCAILVSLGVWQVQRLAWKTAILTEIDATLTAAPVDLPAAPDQTRDKYLPVTVTGDLTGPALFVLVTPEGFGPGYRYIQALDVGTRAILVDLGWVPLDALDAAPATGAIAITGNLHWPDEVDGWTPPPDPKGIWFARDVPAMAAALGTEPLLVVLRETSETGTGLTPQPVDTSGIPNDHLGYAITWFGLALVWLGMTAVLIRRITRPKS